MTALPKPHLQAAPATSGNHGSDRSGKRKNKARRKRRGQAPDEPSRLSSNEPTRQTHRRSGTARERPRRARGISAQV